MHAQSCSSCQSAIDHCHGTLIVHANRGDECTEEDCVDKNHSRHTFVVDCGDVAGGCTFAKENAVNHSHV